MFDGRMKVLPDVVNKCRYDTLLAGGLIIVGGVLFLSGQLTGGSSNLAFNTTETPAFPPRLSSSYLTNSTNGTNTTTLAPQQSQHLELRVSLIAIGTVLAFMACIFCFGHNSRPSVGRSSRLLPPPSPSPSPRAGAAPDDTAQHNPV